MCGIVGGYFQKELPPEPMLRTAMGRLERRGPDSEGLFMHRQAFLGHRRLSILDVSHQSDQPFRSPDGRYALVYNGEIYNFRALRDELTVKGHTFRTTGDTEVLLHAFLEYGENCLHRFNGFFAFAIYDKLEDRLFLARDRLGIKPLYYYQDGDRFLFASELKALYGLGIRREIDFTSLAVYFQLNYIPGPYSIYKQVRKLPPGHKISVAAGQAHVSEWYRLPYDAGAAESTPLSYEEASQRLAALVEQSVTDRLVADVPLGAFLSGGVDSTIVSSLAAAHKKDLHTFSIGFRDESFFDETAYAEQVARRIGSEHHVFKLGGNDLLESLHSLLPTVDEPFADSSALLVNLLSKYTRQHVTVALSGDGGDELFAGYNKHYGEYRMRKKDMAARTLALLGPLWKALPKGRHSLWSNRFRQFERFAAGMPLPPDERYWRWCSFVDEAESQQYFLWNIPVVKAEMLARKKRYTGLINPKGTLNDNLYADTRLVLPGDMLTKVDRMSMANSLEVRVPLLDHRVAEFAFSLPVRYKIDGKMKKKILQDAFRHLLPDDIYNRPKKGFEVPMLPWLRTELKPLLDELLGDAFLSEQQIFDREYISALLRRLHSRNPGDVHAQLWALLVFQSWYKNYHLS